jgi:hypothetical protein
MLYDFISTSTNCFYSPLSPFFQTVHPPSSMMAPSGGGKGGRGGGPAPQAAYQQAYQDFSYEDDGPAPPNFGVGSGFGGRFAGLGYLEGNVDLSMQISPLDCWSVSAPQSTYIRRVQSCV